MMWPVYALLIWMVGWLLVDLFFDCTGDRTVMIYLWPVWLPVWLVGVMIIRVAYALTQESKP